LLEAARVSINLPDPLKPHLSRAMAMVDDGLDHCRSESDARASVDDLSDEALQWHLAAVWLDPLDGDLRWSLGRCLELRDELRSALWAYDSDSPNATQLSRSRSRRIRKRLLSLKEEAMRPRSPLNYKPNTPSGHPGSGKRR
jgi:hypothetical protein